MPNTPRGVSIFLIIIFTVHGGDMTGTQGGTAGHDKANFKDHIIIFGNSGKSKYSPGSNILLNVENIYM